jgi:hypothetical protein
VTDGVLDRRFAWRWLLPLDHCCTLRTIGFSSDERTFLAGTLPLAEATSAEADADVWLINGSAAGGILDKASGLNRAQVAAVVAHGLGARKWRRGLRRMFPALREYAFVPSSHPQVLIPLASGRHAAASLSLHRPGRRVSRAAFRLLTIAARLRFYLPLRNRVLLIAVRSTDVAPSGAIAADMGLHPDSQSIDYALYLGTTFGNRKTVILPLPDGDPENIVKHGVSTNAMNAVRTEATVLRDLEQSSLARYVPRVHALVPADGALVLTQEYRQRRPVSAAVLQPEVVRFLAGLSAVNRDVKPVAFLLKEMGVDGSDTGSEGAASMESLLRGRLEDLSNAGAGFYVHRCHGDFTPWNCLWTRQGLMVIDWEESRPHGLALQDAFNYAVTPKLLMARRFRPANVFSDAIRLSSEVVEQAELRDVDLNAYLALWLLHWIARVRRSRPEMFDRFMRLAAILAQRWE